MLYKWARFHKDGYEVSTVGDKTFSAFYAKLSDGRSIEEHYQCDIKGYKHWKLGKGKPPIDPSVDTYNEYIYLWDQWADLNPDKIHYLSQYNILTDRFATSSINQAMALSTILNNRYSALISK